MTLSATAPVQRAARDRGTAPRECPRTLVACPDSRPPAYQAAIGLDRGGSLDRFLTGFYYNPDANWVDLARRVLPSGFARLERGLRRRHHPEIPADRVDSTFGFDAALALENRVAPLRHLAARWRTRRFDRQLASKVEREHPEVLLTFSDVGSEYALAAARRAGVPAIVSVVHGEVQEEIDLLDAEAHRSPEFASIYLGDGRLDRRELAWLHDRRRRDAALADLLLVPSEHIAGRYRARGIPAEKLRVIPYAADTSRFRPITKLREKGECIFLFAGGITQRKGIGYLLQAWQLVRRPGWRLQLLGALPADRRSLDPYLGGVELLGRIPHHEVPERMAAADVFVFPSLFEGSAVVTYEALASGLPSIVTPSAGSVARHEVEGLVVPTADVGALAAAMIRLGTDPDECVCFGRAARARAEDFGWDRYHASILDAVRDLVARPAGAGPRP